MGLDEQRGSGLPGFGEDSRESGGKKLAMINGSDKLSHLERQKKKKSFTRCK